MNTDFLNTPTSSPDVGVIARPQRWKNATIVVLLILFTMIASFWLRSWYDARRLYDPQCVSAPSSACIESLRRSASWLSPGNSWAQQALKDLSIIASNEQLDPFLIRLAQEAEARAIASSRSMIDSSKADTFSWHWDLIATISFVGWITTMLLAIWRCFNHKGQLSSGSSRKLLWYAVSGALFFCLWITALSNL